MFNINTAVSDTVPVLVTVRGQKFTLLCRRPTAQQRIDDDGTAIELRMKSGPEFAAAFRRRFYSRLECVTGWSEVQDSANEPVPFTREKLLTLLNRFPELLEQLTDSFHRLFDANESAVGEPEGKPGESPPDGPEQQVRS